MPDFPRAYDSGLGDDCSLSTADICCPPGESVLTQGASGANTAWPAALRAIYVPVLIPFFYPVQSIGCAIGTASGNLDLGIYDEKWNRIVGKGSTAAVAGSMWLDLTTSVNGTASPILQPGVYFLAMVVDNTTCTARCITGSTSAAGLQAHGVQQQALGALPLGATATPTNPASSYLPYIAISTASGL